MQQAIDYLIQKDPVFDGIIKMYGSPTIPRRPQGFATLALLILEQQVSIDSAKAAFAKLKSIAQNFLPAELVHLTDDEFRSAGVSRQKTVYIKGLATAVISQELDLESLHLKSADKIREELIKLKGIGNWTIDIYLMFALEAADILPIGDIAVINTIKEFWNLETRDEMLLHAENWAPYRSYATFILWHHYLKKRNRTVSYEL